MSTTIKLLQTTTVEAMKSETRKAKSRKEAQAIWIKLAEDLLDLLETAEGALDKEIK